MNWDAVAALGQLGGIIVTAWAVIVSLKIARMTQEAQKQMTQEALTPKLKINANFHRDFDLSLNDINKYTFFASATNVNTFPISIQFVNFYFENSSNSDEYLLFATEDLNLSSSLPIVLQPGESIRADISLAYFIAKFYKEGKTAEDTIYFRVEFWNNTFTSVYSAENKIVIYKEGFTLKNNQFQEGCLFVLFPRLNANNDEYILAVYGKEFEEYKEHVLVHRNQYIEEKPGRELIEFFSHRFR